MSAPPIGASGRVYDRGYRPYEGELGGQRAARAALWRASVRRALGLRRPMRQKIFPWFLLAIATVPAIVNVGIAYITRDQPFRDQVPIITYREYVGWSTSLIVFIALTAPDIICPDRRNRSLPLYFSRPLTGLDYVAAKVGAIAFVVFAFGFIPQAVLFIGQTFVSDGSLDYVTDNVEVLWKVPLAVLVVQAVFYAAFSVAIAAHTTRRIVAASVFLISLLVMSIVAGIMTEANGGRSIWAALNIGAVPLAIRDFIFLGEPHFESPLFRVDHGTTAALGVYLIVLFGSLAALVRRYRWAQA